MPRPDPDERAFRQHVSEGRFQMHVDRGEWRLIDISWPHALVAVAAAPREGAPDELVLRFTLDGYPALAPTAAPWDLRHDAPLSHDLWPTGGRRIQLAFNPGWNSAAIYIPCDRLAISGHDAWRDQHAAYVWDPTKDIVDYLKVVHELLHSADYAGVRRAA